MELLQDRLIEFNWQLAKLFYGVAAADKKVREEEILKLKKMLRTEWYSSLGRTEQGMNESATQIETAFDWLLKNDWNKDHLIPDFKAYFIENINLFTPEMRGLILRTAEVIAAASSGKNKSELVFISRLHFILTEQY